MWKPRAIISSWALSKLPLMILSNGKSVAPPWSRSHFFPSVSVHFLLVRFMQLYVLCPFFLSQIPPLCFIHVYQSCTNRLPLGKLPVPGGISQCGRWVIHHDKVKCRVLGTCLRSWVIGCIWGWLITVIDLCVECTKGGSCGGMGLSGGDVRCCRAVGKMLLQDQRG